MQKDDRWPRAKQMDMKCFTQEKQMTSPLLLCAGGDAETLLVVV